MLVAERGLAIPTLLSAFAASFGAGCGKLFSTVIIVVLPPMVLCYMFDGFFVRTLSNNTIGNWL